LWLFHQAGSTPASAFQFGYDLLTLHPSRMPWPKLRPRSLRRLAVRRLAEAEQMGRAGRAWRRARRWAWMLFHHRLWSLVLPVAGLLAAFVVSARVSLRPFRGLDEAPEVLEILWQVQAASLALSLAVVIFIFEAVYSARPRPSIRDLAEGVGLPALFYAGVGGLALTGMVVLGGGSGAPGGWAATWAVIWAALSGAGLIALFVVMLRDIEPDALYGRWLARLREQVEQAIEAEIFQRVAINLLNDVCRLAEIEFHPVFGSWGRTQLQQINAPQRGVIWDINLWRVAKAGRLSIELNVARANGDEKPAVLVYIGGAIGEGQPVMRVARAVAWQLDLERAFKLREREPGTALDVALTQLHDEAVRLIRDGSPGAYARITDVYESLLLSQPETWARYGQRFGPDVAGGLHPFDFTLFDRVQRRLYEELELAVMSPSREIGRDALNLPIAVAFRTIEPRAIALAGRMLQLFAAVENALIRAPASDKQSALFGNSWLRLTQYGRAVEHLVTDDESSAEDRAYGATALRQVFEAYALIAKSFIDQNPRETGSFREINRYLNNFLRHWNPEHDRPHEWEIGHLEARDDTHPREVEQFRSQLADKLARVTIKAEMDAWRAAQRFALLAWSLRRLRESGDTVYVEPWNAFVGYFGDVGTTARVVDHVLEADFRDGAPWSHWTLAELPPTAHYGGLEGEFLQTFVVVALSRVDPGGPVPQIPVLEWLANQSANIQQVIEAVLAQETLRRLLPAERLEERAETVIAAIDAMRRARDERREQRLIDAPLGPEAVEAFRTAVRTTWESHRLIGPALICAGMYEVPDGAPPDATRFGIQPERTLKGLFIEEERIHGGDTHAADIGRALAASEVRHYAELAREATELVADGAESLAETLRRAISEVRQHGSDLIVLMPLEWRLIQALELTLAQPRGGNAEPPRWVSEEEESREWFVGNADDVPVFELYELPPARLVVIALDRFACWRQWKLDDDHQVHVSITDYDDDVARSLVEENPNLYRTDERTTVEARAREVRKTVLLDVFERFAMEVVDASAARWVAVPDELREH
jgi:hypothetical protein